MLPPEEEERPVQAIAQGLHHLLLSTTRSNQESFSHVKQYVKKLLKTFENKGENKISSDPSRISYFKLLTC